MIEKREKVREKNRRKREKRIERLTEQENDIIAGNGSILSLHDYILFIMFKK